MAKSAYNNFLVENLNNLLIFYNQNHVLIFEIQKALT